MATHLLSRLKESDLIFFNFLRCDFFFFWLDGSMWYRASEALHPLHVKVSIRKVWCETFVRRHQNFALMFSTHKLNMKVKLTYYLRYVPQIWNNIDVIHGNHMPILSRTVPYACELPASAVRELCRGRCDCLTVIAEGALPWHFSAFAVRKRACFCSGADRWQSWQW